MFSTTEKKIAFTEHFDSKTCRLIFKPKNTEAVELMDLLHREHFLSEKEFENVSWLLESVGARIVAYEDPEEKKY